MRVLITGGAGFIGSYLVDHHINKGDTVIAVDNFSSGTKENLLPFSDNPNFQLVEEDIITWPDIEKTVSWADRIYHMAAVVGVYKVLEEPSRVLAVNIAGCERLLRAVNASYWKPQVVIASSSEVYGPSLERRLNEEANLIVESAARNRWHYSVSKLADESFGLAYHRKFSVPVVIARLFNTIGPRQTGRYGMVVPRFIEQAIQNQPITIYGDGNQTRSFCDVRDVVKILDSLASSSKSNGQVVNVGNDQEISITELAQLIKKIAKSDSTFNYISYLEAYGEEYEDIIFRRPSLDKLLSLTNYKFDWTLEDSILDIIKTRQASLLGKS